MGAFGLCLFYSARGLPSYLFYLDMAACLPLFSPFQSALGVNGLEGVDWDRGRSLFVSLFVSDRMGAWQGMARGSPGFVFLFFFSMHTYPVLVYLVGVTGRWDTLGFGLWAVRCLIPLGLDGFCRSRDTVQLWPPF